MQKRRGRRPQLHGEARKERIRQLTRQLVGIDHTITSAAKYVRRLNIDPPTIEDLNKMISMVEKRITRIRRDLLAPLATARLKMRHDAFIGSALQPEPERKAANR